MPELPEVEVVRRGLEEQLHLPQKLKKILLHRADLRNKFNPKALKKFEGQSLLHIARRSKYLLFQFGQGGILSHLGMTGHWRVETDSVTTQKHDHVRLIFENQMIMTYNDPRRFGFFDSYTKESEHPLLKNIGPEPLEENFTGEILWQNLRGRLGPIKNILMNQSIVAGVGNIYASEVLHHSRVKPSRKAQSLTREECVRVVRELKILLEKSIRLGGSSFDDFKQVSGEKGGFQNHFWVYDRGGEKCRNCGHVIRKKVFAGRSTYWCSQCQK